MTKKYYCIGYNNKRRELSEEQAINTCLSQDGSFPMCNALEVEEVEDGDTQSEKV